MQRLDNQPREGLPDREHDIRIGQLAFIRMKIRLARQDYLTAPTIAKEAALRNLVKQEDDLSTSVGFGLSPPPLFGGASIKAPEITSAADARATPEWRATQPQSKGELV